MSDRRSLSPLLSICDDCHYEALLSSIANETTQTYSAAYMN